MHGVLLDDVHLALADDLSDQLVLLSAGPKWAPSVPAETRELAGGRRRLVRRPGNDQTISYDFEVTEQQVWTLKDWTGRRLVVRDLSGRVVWGYYSTFTATPYGGVRRDWYDVSLTFDAVSGSPAV